MSSPKPPPESEAERGDSRGTVVIVDDSDTCLATLEFALHSMTGIDLALHRRAESALGQIEADAESSCCALITDLDLPGMDGLQLVSSVRKLRSAASFPIVVVTGDSDPDTRQRALDLGANEFFQKPYSPAEVRQTLEKLLNEVENPSSKT